MTISMAKKATASSAGNNRVCSDGRGRKDECGSSQRCRVETRIGYRGFS